MLTNSTDGRLAEIFAAARAKVRNRRSQQRKDKSWKKLVLLDILGWDAACMRCGYDRYIGALDFHHKNPADKLGPVETVEEARKCELICANCHREHHATVFIPPLLHSTALAYSTNICPQCGSDIPPVSFCPRCGIQQQQNKLA